METLGITWAGLYFGLQLIGVGVMVGFGITAGMWSFCKLTGWAPVNLTVTTINDGID